MRFSGPHFRESIEYLPGGNVYTQDALYEVSYNGTNFTLGYKRLKENAEIKVNYFYQVTE